MSQNRQAEEQLIVRTLGLGLPSGFQIDAHAHPWAQLVYATDGVLTVEAAGGHWVVPSHKAVWIPAGFEHALRATGRVALRTLYFAPTLTRTGFDECGVIDVRPLLRELVLEVMRRKLLTRARSDELRLAHVVLDQVARTTQAPLRIRLPRDRRALEVARRVLEEPGRVPAIEQLARGSGASGRTLERIFQRETDLTFGRWVQRVRALTALEHLAGGASVTQAGLAVGYESTSAFIAMFRRVVGATPGAYFAPADAPGRGPRGRRGADLATTGEDG